MEDFSFLVGHRFHTHASGYEVLKVLGSGVFGAVTLCKKSPSEEMVAVKFIKDQSSIQSAFEEGCILRELTARGSDDHHIVRFLDSYMIGGYYCFEFEKLDINLEQYRRTHPLTLQEIRPIIKQLAEALGFLKVNNIIHTDLKPDNIMVADRLQRPPRVKVIDFGLAVKQPVLLSGQNFQPLWYRSPEALVRAPITEAIDVWSLGCIAAELLRGKVLFQSYSNHDLLQLIISTIGMLPDTVLDYGLWTYYYFEQQALAQPFQWKLRVPGYQRPEYILLSPGQGLYDALECPRKQSCPEDAESADIDLEYFKDLVMEMLCLDPQDRMTPEDILEHPFVTMSHLVRRNDSYFQSSKDLMEPFKMKREDEPPCVPPELPPVERPLSSHLDSVDTRFCVLCITDLEEIFNRQGGPDAPTSDAITTTTTTTAVKRKRTSDQWEESEFHFSSSQRKRSRGSPCTAEPSSSKRKLEDKPPELPPPKHLRISPLQPIGVSTSMRTDNR